jgi:2-oxoglutarate ferredoxin oxidoreductase subunit alpha
MVTCALHSVEFPYSRKTATANTVGYQRYAIYEDAISPMALPGTPGCIYTAEGLVHNSRGTPSSTSAVHLQQLDKRQKKLTEFDFSAYWAEVRGKGDAAIVTWGSSAAACFEAAARLQTAGVSVRVIALRLLAPFQGRLFAESLRGTYTVMVVEQNHSGQLYHYLCSQNALPEGTSVMARPGPIPFRPAEIVAAFRESCGDKHRDSGTKTKA